MARRPPVRLRHGANELIAAAPDGSTELIATIGGMPMGTGWLPEGAHRDRARPGRRLALIRTGRLSRDVYGLTTG